MGRQIEFINKVLTKLVAEEGGDKRANRNIVFYVLFVLSHVIR